MNRLEQLERRFDFTYPALYKKLYDDGMLDWGERGPHWHATYWEAFKSDPPLLFFGDDIELLELDRIEEETEAFTDPTDYRAVRPEHRFVPFAMTGAGDLYSFQFDRQRGEDVPVTLVPHDSEYATVQSRNLQDFIFRQMLECVVEIDEFTRAADGDLWTNLSAMLRTHRRYLDEKQVARLEEVYSRELFEYEYSISEGRAVPVVAGSKSHLADGLISLVELESVLRQEIGFDGLDQEFVYTG